MACPNKKRDAAIIAEVKRRKTNNYLPFEVTVFTGHLADIQSGFDIDRIVMIENLQFDTWKITLKKE